jgi:N-acetylglucosaminyl-diphospho-decaprenol L-rhamnosyltransferase
MTSVALLVVNYRSSLLALDAIRTARVATSRPLQVVAVDNSVDPAEAEALRGAADVVIASAANAGYAAAINTGRRACDADLIVVSNPDVRFAAGAIDALAGAGAAVAGPALFWDDAQQWLLPPSELHTRAEVAGRALASRWRAWGDRRDRRRFRARLAFWKLERTTRVRAISGAVMAIRAKVFDKAGGFDERFRLYFEENDFLRRVRGEIAYVPAARCRHLYNQSAAGSAEATALYARSEAEYLRKWGGAFAKRFENVGRTLSPSDGRVGEPAPHVTEASPLPTFETAAGYLGDAGNVPDDVWQAYRGEVLYMRSLTRDGRVLRSWTRHRIST